MKKERSIIAAVIAALLIACMLSSTAFGAKSTVQATATKKTETTTMSSEDSIILQIADLIIERAESRRDTPTEKRDLKNSLGLFTTKSDEKDTTKKGTTTTTKKVEAPVTKPGFSEDIQVNDPISVVVNAIVHFVTVIPNIIRQLIYIAKHP